jgi:biopolymer transport protein ExbD
LGLVIGWRSAEKIMKIIIAIAICACLSGCATFKEKALTFDEAVSASLVKRDKHTFVVIRIDRDGTVLISGRPTSYSELEGLRSVPSLPNDQPGVMIEAPPEVKHTDVRAVMDICSKIGLWRINFRAIEKPEESQNK